MSDSTTSEADANTRTSEGPEIGAYTSFARSRYALKSVWRGPAEHPRWERPALLGFLLCTSLLYVWKLDHNGWANAYYSAAVQAGQHNPAAFFFGSSDWGNSISVDKPPLSLWFMGVSVLLFGLSSWSILLPQVLLTLGSAYLVYALIRRSFPTYSALLGAFIFAFTPITVLLARYNNPDPLMIFLVLLAAYAGMRATENSAPRWLWLAAILLGLGFMAKQLQAYMILPALVVTFLVFVRIPWRQRIYSLAAAAAILVVVSLAWPLTVDLTHAEQRPFVGGSTNNSVLELTFGYNGIDRVIQHEPDPTAALLPPELRGEGSDSGFFRLFNPNYGQEIGWLLAPGILSALVIIWRLFKRRFNRPQSVLAGIASVWMITTYMMLSFMGNSFHSYYTASLAPPLVLCCAIGAFMMFEVLKKALARLLVVGGLLVSAICSYAMWRLGAALPLELGTVILVVVLLCAALLAVPAPWPNLERVAGAVAVCGLLVGPVVTAAVSAGTPQSGSNPLSGSVTKSEKTLSHFLRDAKSGDPAWVTGLAIGHVPNAAVAETLMASDPACTWAAATYPGQTAARFQLETGRPIMPLGGFAARDPSPTLEQFQVWVASGLVCYLVEQPAQLEVPGNSPELMAIQAWVRASFAPQDMDGTTVYRLTP